MGDVKASIAKMTGAVVDDLFLFEEYNHRFYLTYTDYEKASSIGSGDVVMAYELPPPPNSERDADLVIPVLMREKVKSTYGYSSTMRTTGKPVPIRVPPKATYDDLARAIRRQLRRYVKFPGADSDSDDGGAAAKTAAAKAADDDSGSDAELDDMLNDIVKSNPVLADSDDEGAAGSSSKANGGAGAASLSLEPFVLRFTNSWGADNGPEIKPGAVDIEFPAPKQWFVSCAVGGQLAARSTPLTAAHLPSSPPPSFLNAACWRWMQIRPTCAACWTRRRPSALQSTSR